MAKPRKKPVLKNGKLHWYCVACRRLHPTDEFHLYQGVPLARCRKTLIEYNRQKQREYGTAPKERKAGTVEQEAFYARTMQDLGL